MSDETAKAIAAGPMRCPHCDRAIEATVWDNGMESQEWTMLVEWPCCGAVLNWHPDGCTLLPEAHAWPI